MAKAKPETAAKSKATDPAILTAALAKETAGTKDVPLKAAVLNPSIPTDKQIVDKAKTDAAAKVKEDKAAAAKVKKDAADAVKEEKAKVRAQAKIDRDARIEALKAEGKAYTGSMLALADRVKSGAYVKGSTGQLRSNDELAQALDGISPTDVVRIGLDMLKIEDNPYSKLNVGQQSMNLRNRMRGAIKKAVFTLDDLKGYIVRNKITVTTPADLEAEKKAKAEKKALADKAKADKAAAAAKEPAKVAT